VAFAAIPLVLLASMLANFAVDVPYWDQWDLVPYLEQAARGELDLAALAAQHSEHRLLFPRVAMLALARASGWDVRWEMALSLLLAVSSLLGFAVLFRRGARRAGTAAWSLLPPLAAVALFSLRQWENWIWGWQLQVHLNVLAVVLGVGFATARSRRGLALVGALVLGFVAQYSFACGLAYWPIVGAVLAVQPGFARGERARRLALWTAVAAAAAAAYLVGYQKPPWTPDAWLFLRRPDLFAVYVIAYLGAPLSPDPEVPGATAVAVGLGAAGLALLGWAAWRLRAAGVGLALLSPFLALAAYAGAAAAVTGVGRLGLGPSQALLSRYTTIGQLLWLADCALLGLLVACGSRVEGRPRRAKAALAGIALALTLASLASVPRFTRSYRLLAAARDALRAGQDSEALAVLHPSRDVLWQRARTLERLGLSVYRH